MTVHVELLHILGPMYMHIHTVYLKVHWGSVLSVCSLEVIQQMPENYSIIEAEDHQSHYACS